MKKREYEFVDEMQGDEAPGKTKKYNFISYIICALAAVVIWLVIMNVSMQNVPSGEQAGTGDVVAACEKGSLV